MQGHEEPVRSPTVFQLAGDSGRSAGPQVAEWASELHCRASGADD